MVGPPGIQHVAVAFAPALFLEGAGLDGSDDFAPDHCGNLQS